MPSRAPLPVSEDSGVKTGRWMVVIFNDDHTPYEAVIQILLIATECSLEEAQTETWEAHHFGQAPVHFAAKDECERVADIIGRIGVKTEVRKEWEDDE